MIRLLTLLLLFVPLSARALESAPATTAHTTATLVTESDTYMPGHPFRVGLRLKIAPGWHTYWSNPGDAGAPPTLDITGATAGPIVYPTPTHEQDPPFTSFVYLNHVLLPVTVTPPSGGGTLHLQAHGTWLVCQKVCVPEEAAFTLDVPPGSGAKGAQAGAFAAADAASPRPSPFTAHIAADGTLRLDAPGISPEAVYFFPADAGVIDQGAAQPFTADAAGLTVQLKPLGKSLDVAKGLAGVLTLTDRMGHTEALQISALPGGAVSAPAQAGVAHLLLLAFLGGLILNLMPCVLPVLAMKALALAKLSGAARRRIRAESLLYTAGVLAAFGAIGAAILVAGALGGAAGWGVQFQSAWFCGAMALLMLAIGLNFSGLFEVGAGVAGVGQSLAARGSFFTGLLAVVVATPCTAPFMATALAAAVALPPVDGMAIFLALGVGLAAPYALLAVAPALAGLLPRPGAWMARLRQLLALPMYATGAWLAWVVWRQAGPFGLGAVLGAGILVGVAAALYGQRQRGERLDFRSAGLAACVIALTVAGLSTQLPAASRAPLAAGSEKFTPARLAALRAAHHPVLVDMSAAWCITCLVNERVALSPAPVRDAFAKHNVAYLVGDWTQQDPDITAFLKQFGRDGVPLYVYFPADGAPQVLPQILTEAEILGRIGA
jgi:thiol:disulfide interchange protein DsbD